MPPERLFIIHNPVAGSLLKSERDGARGLLADIRKTLSHRFEWVETRSPGEARTLAGQAADQGFERIVAVGGDGTVHEVINGIMQQPQKSRPTLGVLPIGSGNDFAFAAGIPLDLRSALDVLLGNSSRRVDVGKILDNLGRTEYFGTTIGIGFDAQVTIQAQKIKALRGFARYFAATLRTIAKHHAPFEVDIVIDRLRLHEETLMITVGNGPREGGGFVTTPDSVIDDGIFEMLLIKPISRPMMLALLPKVLRGAHMKSSSVYCRTFQTLQLTARTPLTVHVDGEIFGNGEDHVRDLSISIEHRALRVLT